MPAGAFAQPSQEEFWADHHYLYRFSVTQGNQGMVAGGYEISTGYDIPGAGSWSIVILSPDGNRLVRQYFDPTPPTTSVMMKYQPNGTTAHIIDPQGATVSTIDLAGSRICDDDGVCEGQYGEITSNCPFDCGAYIPQEQTATIVESGGIGKRMGAILIGLALAATGILMIRGVSMLLDRRHHA
jgi:hypothetical protein